MKRSQRMDVIRSVAEHEELEERKIMGKSQRLLDDAAERLADLRGYRERYASGQRPTSGAAAVRWQDFHRFLSRLDQAIAEQELVVRDGRQRREAHRKTWMVKRQRLESLTRIIDRFKREEAEADVRQTQKQQDALPRRGTPFEGRNR